MMISNHKYYNILICECYAQGLHDAGLLPEKKKALLDEYIKEHKCNLSDSDYEFIYKCWIVDSPSV